eukprot:scaffold2556_cov425-Prasinococcus_capsulatus_cf.AAC.6
MTDRHAAVLEMMQHDRYMYQKQTASATARRHEMVLYGSSSPLCGTPIGARGWAPLLQMNRTPVSHCQPRGRLAPGGAAKAALLYPGAGTHEQQAAGQAEVPADAD